MAEQLENYRKAKNGYWRNHKRKRKVCCHVRAWSNYDDAQGFRDCEVHR